MSPRDAGEQAEPAGGSDALEAAPAPLTQTQERAIAGVLLTFALSRFLFLGSVPEGLFRDELEKGYTALELWTTGRHGVLGAEGVEQTGYFPLFIEVFEGQDRTSAVYQYLSAPVVGLLGLNSWATRLVAALAGWCSVLAGWRLSRRLFGPCGALVALAMLTVHPTLFIFSRWAQQGILSLAFCLGGFLLAERMRWAAGHHQRGIALLAAFALALSAYAYDPSRLVVPLLLMAWLGKEWLRGRWAGGRGLSHPDLILALGFTVLWFPLMVFTLTAGSARLQRVALGDGGVTAATVAAVHNYLSFFSPGFLVVHGDLNWRHRLPYNGFAPTASVLLSLLALPAVWSSFRRREPNSINGAFGVAWLLIAPTAAALTREGNPHALRAVLMIPALAFTSGYLVESWLGGGPKRWQKAVLTAGALLFLVDGARCVVGVWKLNEVVPKSAFESGVQRAMREALEGPGHVFLSAEIMYAPYVALFAERTDPEDYQERGLLALRTQIVPTMPRLAPGDAFVGPAVPGLPVEFHEEPVVLLRRDAQGFEALPGGRREAKLRLP